MKIYHCWRCCQKMPFLDEQEWTQVAPHLEHVIEEIKQYRKDNNVDLHTAKIKTKFKVTEIFEEITRYKNIHPEIIFHHRLKDWGAECSNCGYLLRTPKAAFCAHCGNHQHD